MNKVELKKLKWQDLKTLVDLGGRTYITAITRDNEEFLDKAPHYYTIFVDDEVHVCGGVTLYWNGRGEAWAVLNPNRKHNHLLAVNKLVREFLDACPVQRIEASVDVEFTPGHRWVKFLGFELEAKRLRKFLPDGKDAALYARFNKGAA